MSEKSYKHYLDKLAIELTENNENTLRALEVLTILEEIVLGCTPKGQLKAETTMIAPEKEEDIVKEEDKEKNELEAKIEKLEEKIREEIKCEKVEGLIFYIKEAFEKEELLEHLKNNYGQIEVIEDRVCYLPFLLGRMLYEYQMQFELTLMGIEKPIVISKENAKQFITLILEESCPELTEEEKEAIIKKIGMKALIYKKIKEKAVELVKGLPNNGDILSWDEETIVNKIKESLHELILPISYNQDVTEEIDAIIAQLEDKERPFNIWETQEEFLKTKKLIEEHYERHKAIIEEGMRELLNEYNNLKQQQLSLKEQLEKINEDAKEDKEKESKIIEIRREIAKFQVRKVQLERKIKRQKLKVKKIPVWRRFFEIEELDEANKFVVEEFGEIIKESLEEMKKRPTEHVEIRDTKVKEIKIYFVLVPVNIARIKTTSESEGEEKIVAVIKLIEK